MANIKDAQSAAKLSELKKLYGHEIAVLKQAGPMDDRELLLTLLIRDMQDRISCAIEDCASHMPADMLVWSTSIYFYEIIKQLSLMTHDADEQEAFKKQTISNLTKILNDEEIDE